MELDVRCVRVVDPPFPAGGVVKETGLSKDYSIPSLLLVLNRLKRVELSDGTVFNTEVTKR